MTSPITLQLFNGVQVVVPDALNLITPYVLVEQQDWFELEIKFLRKLLQPGQQVIDIGANYGVYTLSMAHSVGTSGKIWAFEPSTATAEFLAASIAANQFTQVQLERCALSSQEGTAQLSQHPHAELNTLVRSNNPDGTIEQAIASGLIATETVRLTTLDAYWQSCGCPQIDLIKIDAEGEEANILVGGARCLAEGAPLVQYEIKAGQDWHLDLVQQFAAIGYQSYRLVPGLNLLVPFEIEAAPDPYLLNVFCCKPERAAQLVQQGMMLDPAASSLSARIQRGQDHLVKLLDQGAYHWSQSLTQLPYGQQLAEVWTQTVAEGSSAEVELALCWYALSQDAAQSATDRFCALEASLMLFQELCDRQPDPQSDSQPNLQPTFLRLVSLARVAQEYGAQAIAQTALFSISQACLQQDQVDLREPFLAPSPRFDTLSPQDAISLWALAGMLEELERLSAFSSFYLGGDALPRLELIESLGFASDEMQRRYQLVQQVFGKAP
jgi:FkbM family methyltransferase